MKLIFGLFLLTLFAASCNTIKHPERALQKMAFLEGTWQYEDQGVVVCETWKYHKDSLTASNVLSVNRDTLFIENISVKVIDGVLQYKSTTGKYIKEDLKTLPLTRVTKKTATFGYRNHLNSVYIYYRVQKGKLVLEVRDIVDHKISQDKYSMKKIQ